MSKIIRLSYLILLFFLTTMFLYCPIYAKSSTDSLEKKYWYFDFGQGKAENGFTKVTSKDVYNKNLGYGFARNSCISSLNQNTGDLLREDFCYNRENKSYIFSTKVENGTYNVTFVSGNIKKINHTTIEVLENGGNKIDLISNKSEYSQKSIKVNIEDNKIDLRINGILNVLEISKVNKFDFGSGNVEDGFIQITENSIYDSNLGYGLANVEEIEDSLTNYDDPLASDFLTGEEINFDIDLPMGQYSVYLTSGNLDTSSLTSTRSYAEGLLQTVGTGERSGKVGKSNFPIKLNDTTLNLKFTGWPSYVNGIEIIKEPVCWKDTRQTIFLASDSTVQTYHSYAYPQMGWGQVLENYLTDEIKVDNHAIGGRSTMSYVEEGSLETVLSRIKKGDYLLIQFGHNDASSLASRHTEPYGSYKEYLYQFIDGAREQGAIPVLITPVGRRSYDENGLFKNDFYDYCEAMKQVSEEKNVELIDLMSKSIEFYNLIGIEDTKDIFLWLEAGENENYPNGISDNTHFQEYGANEIAKIVVNSFIEDEICNLFEYVKFN